LAHDRRHFRADDLQLNEADFLSLDRNFLQRSAPQDINDTAGDAFG
jgi:hypothetical protein